MFLCHVAARDIGLRVHSLRSWGYSKCRDEDKREAEDLNKVIKYLFADEKIRRFLFVEYEHLSQRVANVKNCIY